MPELMPTSTPKPGTAESGVRYLDRRFVPARNSAAVDVAELPNAVGVRPCPGLHSLADSNASVWVAMTYSTGEMPSDRMKDELSDMYLSGVEADLLEQMRENIDELPGSVLSSPGAKLCRDFAEGVGLALARIPGIRCAVFGDEEDGVELVAHSRASMRQVSFEFGLEESLINIVRIDEKMQRSVQTCGIDKVLTFAEAVAWLNPH